MSFDASPSANLLDTSFWTMAFFMVIWTSGSFWSPSFSAA